jgi:hypothetical protein
VQLLSVRHTELQPPMLSLENGDFAAKATAAVVIIAASKNMHIARFMFTPVLFFINTPVLGLSLHVGC